jgi:hypothetical protein
MTMMMLNLILDISFARDLIIILVSKWLSIQELFSESVSVHRKVKDDFE